MKFNLFKKNEDGTMETTEFEYEQPQLDGQNMPMAHCDQRILHAPGECQFCDHYPYAQALREWWGINFTGQYDNNKVQCPSTLRRSAAVRDLWPGNQTEGYSENTK